MGPSWAAWSALGPSWRLLAVFRSLSGHLGAGKRKKFWDSENGPLNAKKGPRSPGGKFGYGGGKLGK
eukprot:1711952-Pyramimonas_sp.AAC.1